MPRVAARADNPEAGGNRGARAAAGTAGCACEVVWIPRLAAQRTESRAASRQFHQVRFREDQSTCFPQSLDYKCILQRHRLRQGQRTAGGRHVRRVIVVFQDDGNAMERPQRRSVRGTEPIHLGRCFQSFGIDRDDGVQPGSCVVKGLNPIQISLHELHARDLSRRKSRMSAAYCRFRNKVTGPSRPARFALPGRQHAGHEQQKDEGVGVFHLCGRELAANDANYANGAINNFDAPFASFASFAADSPLKPVGAGDAQFFHLGLKSPISVTKLENQPILASGFWLLASGFWLLNSPYLLISPFLSSSSKCSGS